MRNATILLLFTTLCAAVYATSDECTPRLVRLMLGEHYASPFTSPYTATLTYQTYKSCSTSGIVFEQSSRLASSPLESIQSVWDARFCHNTKKNCEQVVYDQFIHTIRIAATPLQPFSYKICNDVNTKQACTETYTSTMPMDSQSQASNKPMKILFFGDHDISKQGLITFGSLTQTMLKEQFDAFLFLGDYGYEFYQDNGKVGDDYIDKLTAVNTAAPMAITAGNHEDNYDFAFFNEKFQMMNFKETQNNYYSFEIGRVHFISLNLHYFNDQVNPPNAQRQARMLAWVEADLKSVNRTRTPWVIAFGHKMIYCKGSDCEYFASDYNDFSTLLNKYKVDLFISGHKHKFQVMKPMKNAKEQSYTLSTDNVMSNYTGFPTIIQGNGGTSKTDEGEVPPVTLTTQTVTRSFVETQLLLTKQQETVSFPTSAQKKAMLFEQSCIGFGKLTVVDEHRIMIESVNSLTNEVIFTISFEK